MCPGDVQTRTIVAFWKSGKFYYVMWVTWRNVSNTIVRDNTCYHKPSWDFLNNPPLPLSNVTFCIIKGTYGCEMMQVSCIDLFLLEGLYDPVTQYRSYRTSDTIESVNCLWNNRYIIHFGRSVVKIQTKSIFNII